MKEIQIVDAVYDFYLNQGSIVKTEVANLYRSADIVVHTKNNLIYVIECKVSDMKKALIQAKTHQLAANKVFVATTKRKSRNSTLNHYSEENVGLIYVDEDGDVSIEISPKVQKTRWVPARKKLIERLAEKQ